MVDKLSETDSADTSLPWPPKVPLRPQKVKKNDLKIRSKSKVNFGEDIENKCCSTTWLYLKTVFVPYYASQNNPFGQRKKSKGDQEFANKQMF